MINAIILVPEITKGMKSVGSKSLLKIKNGKYIIQHQIEQLLDINKHINITVATGFDNDKITKIAKTYQRVQVLYNSQYQDTNFGKCIELYMDTNPFLENIFIVNSGILFRPHTFSSQHLKNSSKIFVLDKTKNNFDIGCNANNEIEYLFYDLPHSWSECVFLNKQAVNNLHNIIMKKSIAQMYVFEIINQLINYNTVFEKHIVSKHNFLKISTIKDLNRAKVFV